MVPAGRPPALPSSLRPVFTCFSHAVPLFTLLAFLLVCMSVCVFVCACRPEEVVPAGRQPVLPSSLRPALPAPPLSSQPPAASQPNGKAAPGVVPGSEGPDAASREQGGACADGADSVATPPLVFSWALRVCEGARAREAPAGGGQGRSSSNTGSGTGRHAGAVSARLLGPFEARLGEPVCFAWQVTRVHSGAEGRDEEVAGTEGEASEQGTGEGDEALVAYDVLQPQGGPSWPQLPELRVGGPWRLAAGSRGVLRLGVQAGASGMVEVVVEPTLPGMLLPPQIRFTGQRQMPPLSTASLGEPAGLDPPIRVLPT